MAYSSFMATTVERLAEQAMKLPGESRARLADLLVESLDTAELGRIDRLWLAEAKRRRDEVRAGKVKTIPGDEARRRVRRAITR
jgi:putative addiction module component (TIGR02574 family)